MAEELDVGIIGGGYAGMAAAVELAAQGVPVTVFESARQLGGRARGVSHDGLQLDNGQHLLLGCYRETLRLIEQVGGHIGQDFLRLPLQLDLHGHFSFRAPTLPAPFHLLAALLQASSLGWGSRMKAVHFMLSLRALRFRLTRDMTVAELLGQYRQDADLVSRLWEPLCIAALNTPVGKASAQVFLNVLRDAFNRTRADSDMLLPQLDLTELFPQRAARWLGRHNGVVHTSSGVEAILPQEKGVSLIGAGGIHRFSHVICAASPSAAARLLRPIAGLEPVVAQIGALEQQPIHTVYLRYPPAVSLPQAMLGLHRRIGQWLFDKGRISGQHGLIAVVISAEGVHQRWDRETLTRKVILELREEFGIAEAPQWSRVIAEKRATFCCAPDLQRPGPQTPLPRLLLAGDYTAGDYPATLEGAVMSGVRCARLLMGAHVG